MESKRDSVRGATNKMGELMGKFLLKEIKRHLQGITRLLKGINKAVDEMEKEEDLKYPKIRWTHTTDLETGETRKTKIYEGRHF